MKDDAIKTLIVIAVLIIAGVAVYYISANASVSDSNKRGYKGNGGSGFWGSLWNNAANIVDAGGRHTAATVTATGNAISSIIATAQKKNGKAEFALYGYSDEKQNYGPYVLGGALILTAGVVGAIILSK